LGGVVDVATIGEVAVIFFPLTFTFPNTELVHEIAGEFAAVSDGNGGARKKERQFRFEHC